MDSPNKGKAKRNREKNFESCEITLITEMFEQYKDVLKEKFNSSSNANVAVNKDKKRQIWDKITEKVNSLGVSVRSVKEVKTKWNNMHQEAKSSYTEIAMDRRRTGGGPAAKPLSATQNKIVEIFKDCPSFTGLAGVDSLTIPEGRQDDGSTQDLNCVPVMESEGLDMQDAVDIVGTPTTMRLLSNFAKQAVPVPGVSSNPPTPDLPSTSSSREVQIIDLHLESEKPKTWKEGGKKRKVKPEDVTQMQYEVLEEQKKKLIEQTLFYKLMNKKLKLELGE